MSLAEQRAQLLKDESRRFAEYLSGLSEDAWRVQSACERWTVGDVVAHLIGGVDNYHANISRGIRGDSSPPEAAGAATPVDPAARLEANARRAIAMREELGPELLPTFIRRCNDLDQLLAGLGPEDWEKPCFHTAAVISAATYVDLRITEVMVHEWDIRSRLEDRARVSPESVPAILDLLPVFVVGRLFQPGANLSGENRFRWDLSGAASGSYHIVVEDGRARMEPASDEAAGVTFSCDAGDFVLLAYGRIGFAEAVSDGRISIRGDRGLADSFA